MQRVLMMALAAALALGGFSGIAAAQDEEKAASTAVLETEQDRMSYALGMQVGQAFGEAPIDINKELFFEAMRDIFDDKAPALSEDEFRESVMKFQQIAREAQQKQMQEEGADNMAAADAFLEENKGKEGVEATESGLQYIVLEEGDGASPSATDKVKVHYRGTLLDGSEFDSSYGRGEPVEFPLNQVIPGWTEGLQLMKVGGKYKFFIHPELAYGARPRPGIPSNSLLVFEVELLDIVES